MRATWNGTVLAGSERTKVVEGNHYFPPDSVNWDTLAPSARTTLCFWKGKASYFHVCADEDLNPDAAWTYEKPWPLARRITGYVAFAPGVRIEQPD